MTPTTYTHKRILTLSGDCRSSFHVQSSLCSLFYWGHRNHPCNVLWMSSGLSHSHPRPLMPQMLKFLRSIHAQLSIQSESRQKLCPRCLTLKFYLQLQSSWLRATSRCPSSPQPTRKNESPPYPGWGGASERQNLDSLESPNSPSFSGALSLKSGGVSSHPILALSSRFH